MAKQKYYVVWKGVKPGVYSSWADCEMQIKAFEGALYKSFESVSEAEKAFASKPHQYIGKPKSSIASLIQDFKPVIPSISVDAACAGNPGLMEYRGVDTETKQQIFHNGPYRNGTNNIGEFLAIVHALALLKKHKSDLPVYTDSQTALAWIRAKKARTKLEMNDENKELFELIQRAEQWLNTNSWHNKLIKWETEIWGEIPADFGRK